MAIVQNNYGIKIFVSNNIMNNYLLSNSFFICLVILIYLATVIFLLSKRLTFPFFGDV